MKTVWVLVFVFAAATAFRVSAQSIASNSYNDVEALEVYSVLIPQPINGKALLVVDTTAKPYNCHVNDSEIPGLDLREAMQDYRTKGEQTVAIEKQFEAHGQHEFVKSQELDDLFKHGVEKGWRRFIKSTQKRWAISIFQPLVSTVTGLPLSFTVFGCAAPCAGLAVCISYAKGRLGGTKLQLAFPRAAGSRSAFVQIPRWLT